MDYKTAVFQSSRGPLGWITYNRFRPLRCLILSLELRPHGTGPERSLYRGRDRLIPYYDTTSLGNYFLSYVKGADEGRKPRKIKGFRPPRPVKSSRLGRKPPKSNPRRVVRWDYKTCEM